MEALPYFLLLGVAAGLLAGLLGVGGGLIIVPVLAWLFAAQGFAAGSLMQLAVATSLATIVVTAAASSWAHHRHGAVRWPVFWHLTPGVIIGAWLAAAAADRLASDTLATVFGVFVLAVAAQMAFSLRPAPHRSLPGGVAQGLAGGVIGLVSGIVGIGGGTLTVPYLTWHSVTMGQAVATSAALGLPIALAGALGYAVAGWGEAGLPAGTTGYIYWPAVAGVVVASAATAPLGARLAHRLPAARLKRFFALFLLAVGLRMLWG